MGATGLWNPEPKKLIAFLIFSIIGEGPLDMPLPETRARWRTTVSPGARSLNGPNDIIRRISAVVDEG
jgi:hypothetical protein